MNKCTSIDDNTLIIKDEKGKEKKCYRLFSFDQEDNKKSFIAYTDGSKDKEGNTVIFANIYDPTGADLNLYPIEDDYDWKIIKAIFNEISDKVKKINEEK